MSQKIISFHYKLTVADGKILDSSEGREPMTFLTGGEQIIPGLEKELLALKVGEKKQVKIPSAAAYGPRDSRKIVKIPLSQLTKDRKVAVGERFHPSDDPHAPPLTVTKVTETHATLDANHPLAGVDLTFDVELTEARAATKEEISHGHAHGCGCDHSHGHECERDHGHKECDKKGGCGCEH
jgi:FKBP-type peptidyl-prolyl cis-trans isomerase SlyD